MLLQLCPRKCLEHPRQAEREQGCVCACQLVRDMQDETGKCQREEVEACQHCNKIWLHSTRHKIKLLLLLSLLNQRGASNTMFSKMAFNAKWWPGSRETRTSSLQ